jgi:hypothetical protein
MQRCLAVFRFFCVRVGSMFQEHAHALWFIMLTGVVQERPIFVASVRPVHYAILYAACSTMYHIIQTLVIASLDEQQSLLQKGFRGLLRVGSQASAWAMY